MKNKSLQNLFIYNGIFVMAAAMLGPLYAIYVKEFVDGINAVTISRAAFLISTAICTFIISQKGDSISNKKRLLMAGFAVRGISRILLIFVGNIAGLIAVQILLGIGESLGSPAFNTIFAENLDKDKHVKAYAYRLLISNITSAIGIILGGIFVKSRGFEILFICMAGLSMISLIGYSISSRQKK